MKLLIIGGTKFIGKAVAELASSQGHEVTLFNRSVTNIKPTFSTIQGNVEELLQYKNRLLAARPDVVLHCIAYTEKHAQDLVEIFKHNSAQLIVLGSQDCYEAFQQYNRNIESSNFPISEDMELSVLKYYWRNKNHVGGEDYDKNLMTEVLMQAYSKSLVRPTVFRLPQVYGPGDHQFQHRHGSIILRILDQQKKFILSPPDQGRLYTYGYVNNIAAAIVHSFENPKTIGKIYNLGEQKVRSFRRWAELYAEAAEWEFEFEILPAEILHQNASFRNLPPKNLFFDCSLFSKDTSYQDPIPLTECIRKTFEWGLRNPDRLGPRADYQREEYLLNKYLDSFIPLISEGV